MGVFPNHEPLVTELIAGELRIVQKGETQVLAIGEGFAEITGTSVGVLTDGAVNEKEIDEKEAEVAVKRAEDLLKSNTLEGEELEATQAALARLPAQIKIKRRLSTRLEKIRRNFMRPPFHHHRVRPARLQNCGHAGSRPRNRRPLALRGRQFRRFDPVVIRLNITIPTDSLRARPDGRL